MVAGCIYFASRMYLHVLSLAALSLEASLSRISTFSGRGTHPSPLLVYFFFFPPSRTCVLRYEAAETREPEASVSLLLLTPRFRGNSFPLATHFHAFHSF